VRTLAIVPVKRFSLAKQRLRPDVGDAERQALAAAMVADVLGALAAAQQLEATLVVTNEEPVTALAAELGVDVIADPHERGQSAAAGVGVAHALEHGYTRVLLAPGDCPALEPSEVDGLLDATGEDGVVIVPDRHGTGTNALVLAPPDAITPSFGPGSCERHRLLAESAGVSWRLERLPSLLLDIDTGDDLRALRSSLIGARASAIRTRSVLDQESIPVLSSATSG
jgi:2-phospho-L-lactate/phosphoenolpyruvate guanylyltransferase